jgi:hypothetical protein
VRASSHFSFRSSLFYQRHVAGISNHALWSKAFWTMVRIARVSQISSNTSDFIGSSVNLR